MIKKIRIGILGIGGVGGYFGGLLAEKYFDSENIEIIFITRPLTEKIIKEKGLKLITPQDEKIIFPHLVVSNSADIGHLDYLICTVKSYHLEESLISLKNNVTNNTVILPLLNGVDSNERISKIFPGSQVLYGCVYIVSRLIEPGVVKETGNIHKLYFGSDNAPQEKLEEFQQIFSEANIDSTLSQNIDQTVWEKFIFISSIASLTSYLNLNIGEILINENYKQTLIKLIEELKLIAKAKNIYLPDDITESTIAKMEKLPFETTSSMHSDFQKDGKTEYISLTEFVTRSGKELNIKTPTFDRILKKFKETQES